MTDALWPAAQQRATRQELEQDGALELVLAASKCHKLILSMAAQLLSEMH